MKPTRPVCIDGREAFRNRRLKRDSESRELRCDTENDAGVLTPITVRGMPLSGTRAFVLVHRREFWMSPQGQVRIFTIIRAPKFRWWDDSYLAPYRARGWVPHFSAKEMPTDPYAALFSGISKIPIGTLETYLGFFPPYDSIEDRFIPFFYDPLLLPILG